MCVCVCADESAKAVTDSVSGELREDLMQAVKHSRTDRVVKPSGHSFALFHVALSAVLMVAGRRLFSTHS